MRALVTGCAGFIGSHLTESLVADGHEVTGLDRRVPDEIDGYEFLHADLAEDDLGAVAEGAETIFHLAAEPGVRASWGDRFEHYMRNNILATQRLLEAVDPGARLVYTSSSSIYGDAETLPTPEGATPFPLSPYGVTKLSGEHLCAAYGLRVAILRLFTVYGPRQRPDMAFHRFCAAALAGEPVTILGDGNQTRDFTYVADAVAGIRAAAEAGTEPGRVFNIGGAAPTTLNDALALIGDLEVIRRERQVGEARDTAADISRAREELGYAPRTSLEDGLASQLESLRGGVAPVS